MTTHVSTRRGLPSALAMLGVAAAVHAQPAVLYVDHRAPSVGDGASWGTAFKDLQFALAVAQQIGGAAEIRVSQGVYTPDHGSGNRAASFRLSHFSPVSAMTFSILGGFGGLGSPDPDARDTEAHPTVLSGDLRGDDDLGPGHDGDNAFCVVMMTDADSTVILDGLTIRAGNAVGMDPSDMPSYSGIGAGITVINSSYRVRTGPVIRNCRIVGNASPQGAAGIMAVGSFTLWGCVIEHNTGSGSAAGGFGCYGYGWENGPEVVDCQVRENSGSWGGGGYVYQSICHIRRSVIENNRALEYGGGLASGWGMIDAENCLITGNSARVGGGVYTGGSLRLAYCTLTANSASFGGGAFLGDYPSSILNSVVWDNAAQRGEALASSSADGEIVISGSDIQGGELGIYGFWSSLEYAGSNIDADPLFRDPVSGAPDFRLMQASPCVNAGDVSGWIDEPLDLDRLSRSVGGGYPPLPDMGCYELQTPDCPADFNGDGYTDGLDYDQFNRAFATGDPRANVNRDGFVDGIDYDQFLIWFDTGC